MAINLATKFSPLVDEAFEEQSKASLVVNSDYDFIGSKSIKIYSVGTAEMNDYGRNTDGTARYGVVKDLSTEIQEVAMEKDKSFTFAIDKMDEDETLGALNAGTSLARQIAEVVIPETDKYVYKKMVDNAGKTVEETITDENAYDSLATANAEQDEKSVPEQGRVCVGNPMYIKCLKADKRAILDSEIGQNLRIKGVIGEMDGTNIQKVPSRLLPDVNYILAHPVATTFAVKLADYKIHEDAPGVSGSLVEGRVYYTAFVRNNKKSAIYVSKKKTAVTTYTITYDANGGTGSIAPVQVEAGKSVTLSDGTGLTAPTGKTFKGWAKSSTAQTPSVESPFTPTKDTTLYAVYGE